MEDEYFNVEEFKHYGEKTLDIIAQDLILEIEKGDAFPLPEPGFLRKLLPKDAPENPEDLDGILKDTREMILPNMTKWRHPKFYGNMPALITHSAILAEMIGLALNNPMHTWSICPAGTELENIVLDWCAKAFGLDSRFLFENGGGGCIYNTIGEGNLLMAHAARYKKRKELGIDTRDPKNLQFVAYYSSGCHYSTVRALTLKDVPIIKEIPVKLNKSSGQFTLDPEEFAAQVQRDVDEGLIPFFFGAVIGGTAVGNADPIPELAKICQKHKMWLNVDAAWTGASFVCPEFLKEYGPGIEGANSIAINFGKWIFAGNCAALFWVSDASLFTESLEIHPEYLKNRVAGANKVVDYKDWTISTRRRFTALRVWYALRTLGISGIRKNVYRGVELTQQLEKLVISNPRLELVCKRELSILCFRLVKDKDGKRYDDSELAAINKKFLQGIIKSGEFYLAGADLDKTFFLRFILNNPSTNEKHIDALWSHMEDIMKDI